MIPIVGSSLFTRAGFANLSSPVDSSLSMDMVTPKSIRPIYTYACKFYCRDR